MPPHPSASNASLPGNQPQIATIEAPPSRPGGGHGVSVSGMSSATNPNPPPIPVVTCDFASDMSTSEAADQADMMDVKDTLKISLAPQPIITSIPLVARNTTNGTQNPNADGQLSPTVPKNRALSVAIDTDMVSEFDPSSSDSGVISRCAVVKPLKFRLCQPIFGKNKHKNNSSSHHHQKNNNNKKNNPISCSKSGTSNLQPPASPQLQPQHTPTISNRQNDSTCSGELEPVIPKIQKPRDPEKEKRRIARKKEKRATLILGLIMGSFIACWLPFFFLYILVPACPTCTIPDSAFALAFWLGYMNSALNPAIYTIFNKDFRRAFRRILFK